MTGNIVRRGQLIVFSGLDGAGKSTQIELLMARLRAENVAARTFWVRGGYTPVFVWLKRAIRWASPSALPKPGASVERLRRFRSASVRRRWLRLALIDLGIVFCWMRLLLLLRTTVVADRYLDDTLVDFRLNFPDEQIDYWRLWRLIERMAPKPDQAFVFVIPVAESLRRSQIKNEPFPDSSEVLAVRLREYEQLVSQPGRCRIDGLRSREELHAEIRRACGLAA